MVRTLDMTPRTAPTIAPARISQTPMFLITRLPAKSLTESQSTMNRLTYREERPMRPDRRPAVTGPMRYVLLIVLAVALSFPALALQPTQPQTDEQIRQAIIQQSIGAYNATGHPCACPYQTDRAGHSCGRRSAYSRPGGAAPLCYPQDVTDGMVANWRQKQH